MADSSESLQTRASLLMRLRDPRDDASWQAFTAAYKPLVSRYCRRQGLQEADADDVAQEVMLQVARSIRGFEYEPQRGRFRGWLGAVVHSKIVRFRRRQARGPVGAGGEDAPDLDNAVAAQMDSEWASEFNAHVVRVALERIRVDFEPPTWRAFELIWQEQQAIAEVAQATGMSVGSLYVAKSRILKRLREEVLLLAEDVLP